MSECETFADRKSCVPERPTLGIRDHDGLADTLESHSLFASDFCIYQDGIDPESGTWFDRVLDAASLDDVLR